MAPVIDDRSLSGQIIGGAFGELFRGLAALYERLLFADSQRAEYYADFSAARVAGSHAAVSSPRKTHFLPLAAGQLAQMHYDGSKRIPIFAQMADTLRNPALEAAQACLQEAADALLTVDQSHPPTRFRMEVAGLSDLPAPSDMPVDWSALDDELAPFFARLEDAVLNRHITQ